MAKRGGFPGGMPGNMNNLMKQAQRMQRQMEEAQKELEEKEVEAAAGGGAVKVKVSGKKEIVAVTIDPEVVDPEDVEMLEDLIMAAANEALRKMDEVSQSSMPNPHSDWRFTLLICQRIRCRTWQEPLFQPERRFATAAAVGI